MRSRTSEMALVGIAVLVPSVFWVESTDAFEYPKRMVMEAGAIVVLGLALTGLALRPGAARRTRGHVARLARDPIVVGVLALVVSATISTVFAENPVVALRGGEGSFAGLRTLAAYGVLFVAARASAARPGFATALTWALAAGFSVPVVYALVQALGFDPVPWLHYGRPPTRPVGTLGNPNHLAAASAAMLPLVAWLCLRSVRCRHAVAATTAAILLVVTAVACVLPLSRGGWLAAATALVLTGVGWARSGIRSPVRTGLEATAVLFLVCVLALSVSPAARKVAGVDVSGGANTWREQGGEKRLAIWRAAVAVFRDHPLLGVGPDGFRTAFARYQTPAHFQREPGVSVVRAHNEPLHLAATQGGLGLLAALLLARGLVVAFRRAFARAAGDLDRGLVVALGASLGALAVNALVSFVVPATALLGICVAAMLGALGAPRRASATVPGRSPPSATAAAVGGALIAGAVMLHNAAALAPDTWTPAAIASAASIASAPVLVALAAGFSGWSGASAQRRPGAAGARRVPRGRLARVRPVRMALIGLSSLGLALALYHAVYRPAHADALCAGGLRALQAGRPLEASRLLAAGTREDPARVVCIAGLASATHRSAALESHDVIRRASLERALELYRRVLDTTPDDALVWARAARVMADLSRDPSSGVTSANALAAFDQAVRLAPADFRIPGDAARAALMLGDAAAARRFAERALETYPEFGPAHALLGFSAAARDEPRVALAHLRRALRARWDGHEDARVLAERAVADLERRIATRRP